MLGINDTPEQTAELLLEGIEGVKGEVFSHCGIDVVLGQIPIHIKTENGRHTLVRSMGPVNLHGPFQP